MSNLLKVAMIDIILSLYRKGWSQRQIATELGINRETVARYRQAGQGGAETSQCALRLGTPRFRSKTSQCALRLGTTRLPPDYRVRLRSAASPGSCSSQHSGTLRGRRSKCEAWRDLIQSKCDSGLTAQRIYQDLSTEHGFAGSYYTVRRFVRGLVPARELPFRRLECEPGDEAQVDFGTGAGSLDPRVIAARLMSFASSCHIAARPIARLSIARPPMTSFAASRTPSGTLVERPGGW